MPHGGPADRAVVTDSAFVVVGASLAGLRAVEAARKAGHTGPITLIGSETELPYDRPPLSKAFLGTPAAPPPIFREREYLVDELGVDLQLGVAASGLDTDNARVVLESASGSGVPSAASVPYDALVIATGARARRLPGTDGLGGVHTLRTLDDARAVRAALDARARTVVVGAGFIGSEIASAAAARGLEVTVLEAAATPLERAVGALAGPAVAGLHAHHGTPLHCGAHVVAVEGDGRVEQVRLADGQVFAADLVVVGIGAEPCTDWLIDSGVRLDNGVWCDATLATTAPGVWAAGDVAQWFNPVFGRHQRLEHWTSAAEQGAVAARNALAPEAATPYATVPYFWSDWYGRRIQFVGTPYADEVRVVEGDPQVVGDSRWIALYRAGDRLVGALTVDAPTEIMKYRVRIKQEVSFDEALAFAASRVQQAA